MVAKDFELDGKVALVAGDSKYWSKYAGAALADAGADVAFAARNAKRIEGAAGEVSQRGGKTLTLTTDMTDATQVQKMVDQVVAQFGKIDILVNANDLQLAKPFLDITESEWHRMFSANLDPVFHACQAVGRQMIKQEKGRIINLISCLAERGVENFSAYCAAMGGVLQLTRALDIEWARHGITINAIGTGWMSEAEKTGEPHEELLLKYIPVKRYGRPEEVGSLLVYLASDTTDFFTGQFLYVDGAAMSHL